MPVKKSKKTARSASAANDRADSLPRPGGREESLRLSHPLAALFKNRQTIIRILIVADGSIRFVFTKGDIFAGFSLTELIEKSLLPSVLASAELRITKAHRSENEKANVDLPGFKFDDPNHPLSEYEQIWLFGMEREKIDDKQNPYTLADSEVRALTNFMNKGGGVFATGDHEDLGAALCGRVPRVSSMRKWFYSGRTPPEQAPGVDNEKRIDTLREGLDIGFALADQEDAVPQEIHPRLTKDGAQWKAHYLLCRGETFVKVLPDHMHEGECVLPTES